MTPLHHYTDYWQCLGCHKLNDTWIDESIKKRNNKCVKCGNNKTPNSPYGVIIEKVA